MMKGGKSPSNRSWHPPSACLEGEAPGVYAEIPSTFEKLAKQTSVDTSRPSIEFYRSRNVIDLLLPVA